VNSFSPDGKEVYYGRLGQGEIWAVPTLGGIPRRVVSGYNAVPSPDGVYFYYWRFDKPGIYRAGKSGLNEELVYNAERTGRFFQPVLIFPGGNDLLAATGRADSPNTPLFRVNLASHEAVQLPVDVGEASTPGVVWAEPGNSILWSRTTQGQGRTHGDQRTWWRGLMIADRRKTSTLRLIVLGSSAQFVAKSLRFVDLPRVAP
jgi:hypothetical protein